MPRNSIPVLLVQESLHYAPETGTLTWLERPEKHFKSSRACRAWNARFAGKVAGYSPSGDYVKICVGGKGKAHPAHRLAWVLMTGAWPQMGIDHKDGNPSNNRWENLREATVSENGRNMRLGSRNRTGIIGVCVDSITGKWRARAQVRGKLTHLGLFDTKEEAAAARKKAEQENGYSATHGRTA